jgi:rhodanese-related sulfurtransferase
VIFIGIKFLNEPTDYKQVESKEFAALTAEPNTVILDVRTPEEFASGHIAGAVNINYNSSDFKSQIDALDQGKTYLVYCHSGKRSKAAVSVLQKQGFLNLVELRGGIVAWLSDNQPVQK